jgi:hypothetical protein
MSRFCAVAFAAVSLFVCRVASAEGCAFNLLSPVGYSAGSQPGDLALADFNNDGYLDVALQNRPTTTVTILLGSATGFTAAPSVTLAAWSQTNVATGDMNKDGKIDLIVSHGWGEDFTVHGAVNVFLGKGDGTFFPKIAYEVFQNPGDVVVRDFNKDGKLDVAAIKDSAFVLLLGLGNGSLVQKSDTMLTPELNITYGPDAITAGDFNADGKLDIAVAERVTSHVHIFLGNGDGTFVRKTPLVADSDAFIFALTTGDYDGDGDDDVAFAEHADSGSNRPLRVHLSNGDGTFGSRQNFGSMFYPYATETGDVDGDGDLDIVVPSSGVQVFLNDGHAGFEQRGFDGTSALGVALGDVDRDGGIDIVASNFSSAGQAMVFSNYCGRAGLTLVSSANPSTAPANVTITGTVVPPLTATPTGTLTLKKGETILGTRDLATSFSLSSVLSGLEPGTHVLTAFYSGDSRFSSSSKTLNQVVELPPFGAPSQLVATSTGGPVTVSWLGTQGVDHYEIWRSGAGAGWSLAGTSVNAAYLDAAASPSAAFLYKVRGISSTPGTGPSPYSNVDLAITFAFTDEELVAGTTRIRLAHLTELRDAVAAARASAGVSPITWAEATPVVVKASHWEELRTAVEQVRAVLALSLGTYAAPLPAIGGLVRTTHVLQLRANLR